MSNNLRNLDKLLQLSFYSRTKIEEFADSEHMDAYVIHQARGLTGVESIQSLTVLLDEDYCSGVGSITSYTFDSLTTKKGLKLNGSGGIENKNGFILRELYKEFNFDYSDEDSLNEEDFNSNLSELLNNIYDIVSTEINFLTFESSSYSKEFVFKEDHLTEDTYSAIDSLSTIKEDVLNILD